MASGSFTAGTLIEDYMTLCGGCGLSGTRETNWGPPEHKCPRWNTEFDALRRIAKVAESIIEGNEAITLETHLKMVVEYWRQIADRTEQLDYEKAIKDYTCTVCGKLDPTSPGKCQKCTLPN